MNQKVVIQHHVDPESDLTYDYSKLNQFHIETLLF